MNNYNSENETDLGYASSPSECIEMVLEQCPNATIANMPTQGYGKCSCQYGDDMREDLSEDWINCLLSDITSWGKFHCWIEPLMKI